MSRFSFLISVKRGCIPKKIKKERAFIFARVLRKEIFKRKKKEGKTEKFFHKKITKRFEKTQNI